MSSPGKRVVLHVGAHKTGTTVVQQYLAGHRTTLRRRLIRFVPRTELSPMVGWGEGLVRRPEPFAALLTDFAGHRRYRTLLASHENICGHPFVRGGTGLYPGAAAPVTALRDVLTSGRQAFDTTIVLSVRPQHELIESYYLQTVNHGSRMSFDAWLRSVDLESLSWLPLLDTLRGAFGAGAVRVVDFHRIRDGGPAYVRHLLGRAGLDVPVDHRWTRPMNASLSARGLQLALRGNAVLRDGDLVRAGDGGPDKDDQVQLRAFLQRHFSNVGGGPRPTLLSDEVRAAVRERYAGEYAALVGAPVTDVS